MKLRIVSDGTCAGTRVENADTGEPVEHVARVEWRIEAPGVAVAMVVVKRVEVDVEGESVVVPR